MNNHNSHLTSEMKADNLIEWLREYAEKFLNLQLADERRCIPPYVFMDWGNQGIFGLNVPEEYGGLGLSEKDYTRVIMQLGAIDMALAMVVVIHTENGIGPILRFGSEKAKQELIPLMASGRYIGAVGVTEPTFGTNFFEMKTTAAKKHDQWILNGIKRWNSANWATVINVFAIAKGDGLMERGMTGFTVLKSQPGVEMGPEALTIGARAIMQNGMIFKDVRIDNEYVLGAPYKGGDILESMLSHARISSTYILLGGMKRAMQKVMRFLTRRKMPGATLIDYPFIVEKLNDASSAIVSIEKLAGMVCEIDETQQSLRSLLGELLKVAASEFGMKIIKQCMHMAGGRGYMENNDFGRLMRDSLASYYGEGANDGLLYLAGKDILYKTEFVDYLERTFGRDPELEEFKRLLQCAKTNCAAPQAPKNYSFYLLPHLGMLGLFMLLNGVSKKIYTHDAQRWAHKKLSKRLKSFRDEILDFNQIPDKNEISQLMDSWSHEIGDIDFNMAGIETKRDPLLKKVI